MTRVPDQTPAMPEEIQRLQRQVADLQALVEQHGRDIQMHVTRMGQLQADIDLIRAAWLRIPPSR
jgi:DNA-directed RNA polymerase specialized sigma24 family protein